MSTVPSRTATPSGDTGSHTVQQTRPTPVLRLSAPSGVLRLRAAPEERRHIQWAEDVIDNEGMGKKSSKVCCIYHAPREAGESSDESSDSSSSDDSDSEPDNSTARPSRSSRRARKPAHDHDNDDCEHDHGAGEGGKPRRKTKRAPSPNAYEKVPKPKK
ncbi:type 1 phosphatases regulator YPI1 [Boeremia exigua]|uniref:type 1 phosphatases regulator YPI1 n=1 Tax=Boeremia exigua TaxID=749465 RepID=UPI001E8EE202|nr:type 1 phosphatases regulator YPI1 [Boeremia exigua]KAH6639636.1 type 1 phosphatases regulator YPI1 [Boeremia exigua]